MGEGFLKQEEVLCLIDVLGTKLEAAILKQMIMINSLDLLVA